MVTNNTRLYPLTRREQAALYKQLEQHLKHTSPRVLAEIERRMRDGFSGPMRVVSAS